MSYRVGRFVTEKSTSKRGEIISILRKSGRLFAQVRFSDNEEKWIYTSDLTLE